MTRLVGIFLAFFLPLLSFAQGGSEALRTKADALFSEQRFAEAMPMYSQLVSLEPADRELNYRFGTTLLFIGEDKEKAVGHLRFATGSPAISPAAWYWLGRAYHLNYRFADALTAYQRYRGVADKKILAELPVDAFEDQCRNGLKLLSKLKDINVRSKVEVADTEFFRFYDLSNIGGRIVVLPDELKTNLDKKRKLRSLVYLPDKGGPIYFSSLGKDGSTGLDIYRSELLPDGKFSTPVKLSGFINTPYDEDHAFMHPDGKTFYFSSKGHSSMGGYDVFRSRYDKGMDAFGRPENMDFAVNTPDDDILYIVDSEQKEACFASGRSSSQGKLHVYRVATTQTPLIITVLRGTFASEFDVNDRKARIVVEDAITREQVADVRTDINGSYVLSLPRSGKFRFMVECGPTGRTHSGTVDVPRNDSPKAYRQELTLTKQGDQERLMIRNYFDEPLDGDIIAMALDEIKRRARLDVSTGPAPVAAEPAPEEPMDVLTQVGFAGDVDYQDVLKLAQEDALELNTEVETLGDVSAAAYAFALEAVSEAEAATKEAEALVAKAAGQSDGTERNATMVQAAMQRQRARDAELRAQAAYRTARSAEDEQLTQRQQAAQADKLATDIARTTATEDKKAALPYLTVLKERLDTKSGPTGRMDFAERTRRSVTEQEQEVSRMMQRANAKRVEESELMDRMNRLRREQEDARSKSKKDELEAQIVVHQEQLGHLSKESEAAFAKAKALERETIVMRGNAGLTKHLLDNGASEGTAMDDQQAEALQRRITASRTKAESLPIDARFDAQIPIRANDRESRSFAWDRSAADTWTETQRNATQAMARNTQGDARQMDGRGSTVESSAEEAGSPEQAGQMDVAMSNDASASDAASGTSTGTPASTQPNGTESSAGSEGTAGTEGQSGSESEVATNASSSTAGTGTHTEQEPGSIAGSSGSEVGSSEGEGLATSARSNAQEQGTAANEASTSAEGRAEGAGENEAGSQSEQLAQSSERSASAENSSGTAPGRNAELGLSPEQVRDGHSGVERVAEPAGSSVVDEATAAFLLENRLAELQQMASVERDRSKRDSLNIVIEELEAVQQIAKAAQAPKEGAGQDGMTDSERADLLSSISVDEARLTPMIFDPKVEDEELIGALYARHTDDEQRLLQLSDADDRAAGLQGLELMLADSIRAEMARQVAVLELDPAQAEVVLPRVERLQKLRAERLENAEQYLRDREEELMAEERGASTSQSDGQQSNARGSFKPGSDPINDRFVVIEGDPRNIYASPLAHRAPEVEEALGQKNGDLARIEKLQTDIDSLQYKADRMSFGKERDKVLKSMDRLKDDLLITRTDLGQRSVYLTKQEWRTATDSLSALEKAITKKGAPPTEPLLVTQRAMKSDAQALKSQAESMRKAADRAMDILVRDSLYRQAYELELRSLREVDRSLTVANYLLSDQHTRGETLVYSTVASRVLGISEEDLLASGAAPSPTRRESVAKPSSTSAAASAVEDVPSSSTADSIEEQGAEGESGTERSTEVAIATPNSVVEQETPTNASEANTSNEAGSDPERTLDLAVVPATPAGSTEAGSSSEAGRDPERALAAAAEPTTAAGTTEASDAGDVSADPARTLAVGTEPTTALRSTEAIASPEEGTEPEPAVAELPEPTLPVSSNEASSASIANADLAKARADAEALALREESVMDEKSKRAAADYEALLTSGSSAAAGPSGILKDDGSAEALELLQAGERVRQQSEQALALTDRAMILEDSAATVKKKRDRQGLVQMAVRMRTESDSLQRMALLGGNELREAERAYVAEQEHQALRRRLVKFYYLNADEQSMVLDDLDQSRYFAARTAALAQYDAAAEATEAAVVNRELGEALKARATPALPNETAVRRAEREAGNVVLLERADALLQRADSLDDVSRRLKGAAAINESQASVMLQGASEEDATELMALEMRTRRTEPLLAVARDQAGVRTSSSMSTAGSTSATNDATAIDDRAEEAPLRDVVGSMDPRSSAPVVTGAIPKVLTQSIFEIRPVTEPRVAPIPMDADMPEGIVFKVQIGAFRNAIPEETFRDMTPVMGENVGSGLVRYTAGLFTSFDQAAGAKDQVRDRGYRDAFVVAYRDGVRMPLGEAMRESRAASIAQVTTPPSTSPVVVPESRPVVQQPELAAGAPASTTETGTSGSSSVQQPLVTQPATEQPATAPVTAVIERPSSVVPRPVTPEEEVATILAKYPASATEIVDRFLPTERATDYYNVPGAAPARQVETVKGLFFTVQVGVYSKPVALDKLFNISPLNSELTETGKIRYTTGMFVDSEVARQRKDGTVQLGVKDAFVTAYLNGKRIPMREAAALLERFGPEILAKP